MDGLSGTVTLIYHVRCDHSGYGFCVVAQLSGPQMELKRPNHIKISKKERREACRL